MCGVNFCPDTEFCDANKNNSDDGDGGIQETTRYTLAGIYLGCSLIAAVLIALFLDPLTRYGYMNTTLLQPMHSDKIYVQSTIYLKYSYSDMEKKNEPVVPHNWMEKIC